MDFDALSRIDLNLGVLASVDSDALSRIELNLGISASVDFEALASIDLNLGVPASVLARGSSDQSLQRQRVHTGGNGGTS